MLVTVYVRHKPSPPSFTVSQADNEGSIPFTRPTIFKAYSAAHPLPHPSGGRIGGRLMKSAAQPDPNPRIGANPKICGGPKKVILVISPPQISYSPRRSRHPAVLCKGDILAIGRRYYYLSIKLYFHSLKPNESGGLAEILLFISLNITFPCNTESPVKPGPRDPLPPRLADIALFETTTHL